MVGVVGVPCQSVVVHVDTLLLPAGSAPGLTAICAEIQVRVHRVDVSWPMRIEVKLVVVLGVAAGEPARLPFFVVGLSRGPSSAHLAKAFPRIPLIG